MLYSNSNETHVRETMLHFQNNRSFNSRLDDYIRGKMLVKSSVEKHLYITQ